MRTLTNAARRRLRAVLAGLIALGVGAGAAAIFPEATVVRWREAATDAVLLRLPPPEAPVVVVDIDRATIAAIGPWPWPRETLARLVTGVLDANPRAVALDMLLEGQQQGDAAMAAAIAGRPVVLGALLGDAADRAGGAATPVAPAAPIAIQGPAPRISPWVAPVALVPSGAIAAAAGSIALSSIAADSDGRVRRVPLFAGAGDRVLAGLAIDVARLASRAGTYIVDGDARRVRVGPQTLPLTDAADMRIRPATAAAWAGRTVSALAVMDQDAPMAALRDRIVLIGGSAPDLGALRSAAAGPITPAVQLQADAVATILSGRAPFRPDGIGVWEALFAFVLGLAAAIAAALLAPGAAAFAAASLAATGAALAVLALVFGGLVADPVTPALAALLAGSAALLATANDARRASAALQRRFEQYLAPSVVARIAARPDLVKLAGERREITVLCTDIENFTGLTERVGPEDLVRLLDAYFTVVVEIVVGHGGMVDKIWGDAVIALFNAPVDLPDHASRAVDAAIAIRDATDRFRREGAAAAAGLARTRIGVETGMAVVGDVGARGKLDYTAYGNAVNTAARLETLNKTLGSAICVGPATRAACPTRSFRALGGVEVRGRGMLALYEPS